MKSILFIIWALCGIHFSSNSQDLPVNKIDSLIDGMMRSNDTIVVSMDANEVYHTTFDGGGLVRLHYFDETLILFESEIGTSFGRVIRRIYYHQNQPIKIVETEEDYPWDDSKGSWDQSQGTQVVYQESIYILDWEQGETQHIKQGERVLSEETCGIFEFEPEVQRGLDLLKSIAK